MPVKGPGSDSLYLGKWYRSLPNPDIEKILETALSLRYDYVALPLAKGAQIETSAQTSAPTQTSPQSFFPSVESDLVVTSRVWSSSVVGVCSEGLNPDAEDEHEKRANEGERSAGGDAGISTRLVKGSYLGSTSITNSSINNSTITNSSRPKCPIKQSKSIAKSLASQNEDRLLQELSWAAHLGVYAVVLPRPNPQTGFVRYAAMLNRFLLSGTTATIMVRIPLSYFDASGDEVADG
jgi:hypothetical protein